ncbi:MAG: ankyrin repeat domain-containing protein [Verrucomicrobiia bacterium]
MKQPKVILATLTVGNCAGDPDVIKALLEQTPVLVHVTDTEGVPLAQWAMLLASTEIVNLLLENGLDVNARFAGESTLLHMAAELGTSEIIELLLSTGAEVNARDQDGMTALHIAARGGDIVLVKPFLSWNADIDAKDNAGKTPMQQAVEAGHTRIVDTLREYGAKE